MHELHSRLFVYGTLAPGRPNEHILADLEGHWQPASVRGVLQEVGGGATLGFPGIEPSETGDHVEGFLFVSADLVHHWERLDDFEGEAYERVVVQAMLTDGSRVEAYVYAIREMPLT